MFCVLTFLIGLLGLLKTDFFVGEKTGDAWYFARMALVFGVSFE